MTREERHIAVLNRMLESMDVYDSIQPTTERKKAIKAAIQALSQEPCDDTVSIRKDVLKCRVGNIVAYNVEWLKKHWQMEMDIVCGVKPCDDAISREALIAKLTELIKTSRSTIEIKAKLIPMIEQLPSVTQKSGHWIHFAQSDDCSECGWSTGKYISPSKYCPNCGAKMVEPQESEE